MALLGQVSSFFGILFFATFCVGFAYQNAGNCGAIYWTEAPVVGKPFIIYFPDILHDVKMEVTSFAPGARENYNTRAYKPGINYIQYTFDTPGEYFVFIYYSRFRGYLYCNGLITASLQVSGETSMYTAPLETTYRTSAYDNYSFMFGVNSTTPSFSLASRIDYEISQVSPAIYNDAYKNDGLWLVHYSPFFVEYDFSVRIFTSSTNNQISVGINSYKYSEFGPTNLQPQYQLNIDRPGSIRFNAYLVTKAYVSYNLSREKIPCNIMSTDAYDQTIKCPPPRYSGLATNMIIARFEFHNAQLYESEVYSQILIGRY